MAEKPKNENIQTSAQYYFSENSQKKNNRSYICLGSPRCGTSMVAGAMACLGIDMGSNLPVNIEDPTFNPDGKRSQYDDFISDAVKEIEIKQNNGGVWGWKYPQAVEYLPRLKEHLTNPHLVIVYRDPIPAVIRATRPASDAEERNQAIEREMRKSLTLFRKNFELAMEWKVPTLLVSYERSSLNPERLLNEMSEFFQLPLPKNIDPILEFMTPGSYKNLPRI